MTSIFDDFPSAMNGLEGLNQTQRVVQGGSFRVYTGQIMNVRDHHLVSNHYDVALDVYNEVGDPIVLREVKLLSPSLGFDGANSVYFPLRENTPVLLLARDGILDQAVIIGSFNTSGDHRQYLINGQMDRPGIVYDDYQGVKEANQGSAFPYRMAQPMGFVRTVGGTNITSQHDDSRYYFSDGDTPNSRLQEKAKARQQIVGVELMNEAGHTIHHMGPVSLYSHSQVIILSQNTQESECARMMRHAAYYSSMYEKIKAQYEAYSSGSDISPPAEVNNGAPLHGVPNLGVGDWLQNLYLKTTSSGEGAASLPNVSTSGATASASNQDPLSYNYLEALPASYHLDQLYKLASMYREQAGSCNTEQATTRELAVCVNPCEQQSGSKVPKATPVYEMREVSGEWSAKAGIKLPYQVYSDLIPILERAKREKVLIKVEEVVDLKVRLKASSKDWLSKNSPKEWDGTWWNWRGTLNKSSDIPTSGSQCIPPPCASNPRPPGTQPLQQTSKGTTTDRCSLDVAVLLRTLKGVSKLKIVRMSPKKEWEAGEEKGRPNKTLIDGKYEVTFWGESRVDEVRKVINELSRQCPGGLT